MAKKAKAPDTRTDDQKAKDAETKQAEKASKFLRLATKRMDAALTKIALIGALSNRSSYAYSPEQIAAMEKALDGALNAVFTKYKIALEGKKENAAGFNFS